MMYGEEAATGMGWLWCLAVIAVLVIKILVAREFGRIAEDKGYEERKYYVLPFFLGIIGYLLIVALPDRHMRSLTDQAEKTQENHTAENNSTTTQPDLPEL